MAERLLTFETPAVDASGAYRVHAVGRHARDGMWDGWLEFEPLDHEGATLVGPVESRQPERDHLQYWAGGLTPIYIEGALARARRPVVVRMRVAEPRAVEPHPRRQALLDPFAVAGHSGLDVLAQELRALNRPRLLDIIAEYDLNPRGEALGWLNDLQLVRFITVAVEAQLLSRLR